MRHLMSRWRALWNPDMFHGWGRRRNFFEGWYFKLVDPAERHAFAVIPGIAWDGQGERHAFIQLLDGKRCVASYHRFSADDFRPSPSRFELSLGDNFFSAERLELHLPELRGALRMRHLHPWPKQLGAPGIMGWYSFVPFMECYHGVVSLHHTLDGTLETGDGLVAFTGGLGYTEKDWGRSFPSSWIWMQSNHFDTGAPASLTVSVARIPWLGSHFIGFIVGWLYQGRLYRFATYTGAAMRARLEERSVRLAFRDRRRQLEIVARQGPAGRLLSPLSGAMMGKVNESMQAAAEVRFQENGRLLFEGLGQNAGLEIAGPVEELLCEDWRR